MKTFDIVKTIILNRLPEASITVSTPLVDLGFDSLDLVEIALEVEDKFHIEFTSGEISDLATIGDVCKIIDRKTK